LLDEIDEIEYVYNCVYTCICGALFEWMWNRTVVLLVIGGYTKQKNKPTFKKKKKKKKKKKFNKILIYNY
jgi:hypothetical protein